MLGNYLSFDDKVFPNPISEPLKSANPVETVVLSEAGTDLVVMSRSAKHAWNFSFELSSERKAELAEICKKLKVTMVYQGVSYKVRVRNYQERTVSGSEWLSNANGLYRVSVNVTKY